MLESPAFWFPLAVGSVLWASSRWAGESRVYLRSWIPSWRFFENTGEAPVLEFVVAEKTGSDRWKPVPNPGRAVSSRIWFSPASNAFHAFETLVLDFAIDPSHPDLESCLVEESIRRVRILHPDAREIRLRVRWSEPVWERTWNSHCS